MNNDKQAGANGISDAEIAGIMGWRGPGAYTEASLRKIKQILEEDRSRRALALSHAAPQIKTWQERMPDAVKWIGTASSEAPYKDAEIADLRAALARAPLPARDLALTNDGREPDWAEYTAAEQAQADDARDAALLDFLDMNVQKFRMGWEIIAAPVGSLSIRAVIMGGQPIRDAIRAAMSRNNDKGGE